MCAPSVVLKCSESARAKIVLEHKRAAGINPRPFLWAKAFRIGTIMDIKRAVFLAISFPLIALWLGFVTAFLALQFNTLIFALLPVFAFALGYFSVFWQIGALSGFALFLGYTFAASIMEWGINDLNVLNTGSYFFAFILGGFSLPLLGACASLVRKSIRLLGSRAALAFLAVMVVLCGYSALPHYGYYYQVVLYSSENLEDLEIYLPIGAVSGEPYAELLNHSYYIPDTGGTTENYAAELADTPYGIMLKLAISGLEWRRTPNLQYTANIILWKKRAPLKLIQLMPKYDVSPFNTATRQYYFGSVKTSEKMVVERFEVPVKISSDKEAQIEIILQNRTDRFAAINFAYTKNTSYTETIRFEGSTGSDWVLLPVEATKLLKVRSMGD